jgi:dTDP-4-amino-4,6-dideoxygalactose transaminase
MYYLVLPSLAKRTAFIEALGRKGILAVFHYVPLHDSPMGRKLGRAAGDLRNTVELSERLVRLPLWLGLEEHQEFVIEQALAASA